MNPADVRDEGERLVLRLRRPRWVRWAWPVAVALLLVDLVSGVVREGAVPAAPVVLLLTFGVLQGASWWLLRREYVVDGFGVDRPRRGRRIPWGEVDHVEKPGPFHDTVLLVLTDGSPARTPFPAHLSARVAELGRVPLRD